MSAVVEAVRPAPPVGLYIHVPFCVSVCPYCDFVVVAGASARGPRNRMAALVDALHRELDLRADALEDAVAEARPPLHSLYLGGGTPSLLGLEAIHGLITHVVRRFGLAPGAEVTLEANPGPDERGTAPEWVAAGVTRISFGAQAMDDGSLRRLGRRHRPEDVAAAVGEARAAGVRSINLDLLIDVPGQPLEDWTVGLEAALALAPDHLSIYALSLDDPDSEGLTGPLGDHLPVRRGARAWRDRARPDQDEDRAATEYGYATERLAAAGYRGYEISNWARPGHESRHNLAYWERQPVEAVGPGAHAFDGTTRRWNAASLGAYLGALESHRLPPGGSETVSPVVGSTERVMLAMRLDSGLPASAWRQAPLAPHASWARAHGLIADRGDHRVVLTTRGRLLASELFSRLV